MTSYEMRNNPLFTRNSFEPAGKWEIPIIKKQSIDISKVKLVASSNTRANDSVKKKQCGVHFFVDDYRFSGIYDHPDKSLKKYSQYAFLLSPDFSLYADMQLWKQMENVAKNRWVGAYWQSKGLTVIPTISWSTSLSYEFCFDGIEKNGIVAVGMNGCKGNKIGFLQGYNAMLEKLSPQYIIVLGKPFDEMKGNIVIAECHERKKKVK